MPALSELLVSLDLRPEYIPRFPAPIGGPLKVNELVVALQTFPADADVEIYVGKCCDVQPIHRVHFQPADADNPALVVLVDETQRICIPGRRNCSLLFGSRAT